ncbi:MAG TPA: malonate decarboxylase acyl carrier protein [Spirochaetota bacterium]|nr:malonate decarboxylase acyl carrier protein [Spirochaetota bacterium]HPJ34232.1 malonate decarboxylase acyl carrier protein [Spirochaetota bacterium]
MALNELNFEYKVDSPVKLDLTVHHYGVVGSGDMEVLIESADLGGAVKAKIVTPVSGFDAVWEKVLGRFINENNLGNLSIEINDNNATPVIVSMRLRQALAEIQAGLK